MRIVAGCLSGRGLHAPKIAGFRPTGDRVREALFSILGERVSSGTFLELFAGSGGVGIEAWSRGAPRVILVERDAQAVSTIERNLDDLGVDSRMQVIALDAIRALRGLALKATSCAVVFADPPYEYPRYPRLLRAIAEARILQPGGVFVLEHAARVRPGNPPPALRLERTARYGDGVLDFYEATPAPLGPPP